MPRLSQFYGIAIYMYYRDHAPPHFHAVYGEYEAQIAIATGKVINGRLPTAARRLVRVWAALHREQLMMNWSHRDTGETLMRIDGLDAE